MKGSIKLFKIFGIGINIHITFLLLPFLFGMRYGLKGIVGVCMVFLFITAHELCHSLMAKRFRIRVESITLLPIGGIAAMKAMPQKPSQELLISLAGPSFNIIAAALLFYPVYYILGPEQFWPPHFESWAGILSLAFWVNPILAAFNLLPAFPMDGGRLFRALLAKFMDYKKATEIAVVFGHIFAVMFGLFGLYSRNWILVIIAVFIYMAASQEETQVDVRLTLGKFYVKDVLPKEFFTVLKDTPLSAVLELVFRSHQEDFPVVDGKKLVGLLTRSDLVNVLHREGVKTTAEDAMRKQFPTARTTDRLTAVYKKFEQYGIKAMPVVDKEKLVGIITLGDLSRVYTFVK